MGRLFDLYEADLKRAEKASYENVKLKLQKYLRPRLGNREASSVKKSDVEAYKDRRKGEGASNATINRELSYIVRAFRLGIDEELIASYPKVTKLDKRAMCVLGSWSTKPTLPSFRSCRHIRSFYSSMRTTGECAKSELSKLRRDWVRLNEAKPLVKIPGTVTKNGKPRTLPIYGDLLPWFEMAKDEWAQLPACPWVFIYRGKRLNEPREGFRQAAIDAGFPELLFHDLRRTAIRNMERAGVPRAEAMQISGHTTEAVYKRYDIASEKGAIRAGDTMQKSYDTLNGNLGAVEHSRRLRRLARFV
jgi:integrase